MAEGLARLETDEAWNDQLRTTLSHHYFDLPVAEVPPCN